MHLKLSLSILSVIITKILIQTKRHLLTLLTTDNHKHSALSSLHYSCSDKEITRETSVSYTAYGDDHKHINLELSKLQLL